jgi:hypothetical protein
LRQVALFFSYLFHPLLLTTLLIGLLYLYVPEVITPVDDNTIQSILILIFTLTYVIPLCSVLVMKLLGSIESLHLYNRRERFLPFFFIGTYYAITTYLFTSRMPFSDMLLIIFLSITVLIFVVTFLTLWLKISIHAAGMWGMVGFILAIHLTAPVTGLFVPLIVSLLLAGIVSSSRLLLDEHSPREVYYGGIVGFSICFSAIYFLT